MQSMLFNAKPGPDQLQTYFRKYRPPISAANFPHMVWHQLLQLSNFNRHALTTTDSPVPESRLRYIMKASKSGKLSLSCANQDISQAQRSQG